MDNILWLLIGSIIVICGKMVSNIYFNNYNWLCAFLFASIIIILYVLGFILSKWKLLTEMTSIGLILTAIGIVVNSVLNLLIGGQVLIECSRLNECFIVEWSLFITGALAHLLFEITGSNSYYCTYGIACQQ